MLVRRLDSNHDMSFGQGLSNYANGAESVAQRVHTRLLALRGEWFLDTGHGVPYLQEIMVKPSNLQLAESLIKQTILDTDGINELRTFSLDFDATTRQLAISVSVATDFDDLQNIKTVIS